jgi:hypothetical protein
MTEALIHACCVERMYERATPVCAGDTVNRVPTVSIERERISRIPRKSSRKPSHRYLKG